MGKHSDSVTHKTIVRIHDLLVETYKSLPLDVQFRIHTAVCRELLELGAYFDFDKPFFDYAKAVSNAIDSESVTLLYEEKIIRATTSSDLLSALIGMKSLNPYQEK